MILYHLSQAPGEKLRRVDLAEKVGITASGITRMLLPMEKIGLVQREVSEQDARVSYVLLAPGGKRLLTESLESVEVLSQDILSTAKAKKIEELSKILTELGKITVY
jgi:DNA-binding MarR family transcriptional regulator